MSANKRARDGGVLAAAVATVSALAALPAAFFVARSTYFHLIWTWEQAHVALWAPLGVGVAVVAGVVVEGLGTASLFLWTTFDRWNNARARREDGTVKAGYDLAPTRRALVALLGYLVAVTVILVVLEWRPEAATFAPVMFPVLTVVGGLCWSMYEQHRDRLAYHGLTWNWTPLSRDGAKPVEARTSSEETKPTPSLDAMDRAILDAYRDGLTTQRDVADAVGTSKTTVCTRSARLEQVGLLDRSNGRVKVKA